jgi:membrane-associated protease RseP (regulator of RpoE activity)
VKDPLEEASVDVDRRGATYILIAVVVGLILLAVFRPGARDALAIVAGIILMVMLHEAGHYWTAKRAGMKVTEYFLGFGPRLWSFRRGETEYGVKAIPAGGYVRIVGMSNLEPDIDPADEPRTYRKGSYKNRLVVVLAGVTVNIFIAFLLFFLVLAGRGGYYDNTKATTTVGSIVTKTAASRAGMHKGDKIIAVDGTPIKGWNALKDAIESRGGKTATFTVLRHGERIDLETTLGKRSGQGFLGVSPTSAFVTVGVLGAIPESFKEIGDITVGTAEGVGHIFSPSGVKEYSENFGSNAPAAGSAASDARPRSLVGIVDEGSNVVGGDIWKLLQLLGGISLILALFNMLPLLPFDGGHAVIVMYEWAASKIKGHTVRVDYRKLMPVTAIVLVVFLTLGLSAMFLDIKQAVGK